MTTDPDRSHNLDISCYKGSTKSCHSAHLRRSAGTVHSQGHREGTADHMDLKKGTQEIAAAQSQHFLHKNVMCLQNVFTDTSFEPVKDIFQPGWGPHYIRA